MSGESVSGDQVRVNILKGRIRYYTETDDDVPAGLVGELEDELDALRAEVERLREEIDFWKGMFLRKYKAACPTCDSTLHQETVDLRARVSAQRVQLGQLNEAYNRLLNDCNRTGPAQQEVKLYREWSASERRRAEEATKKRDEARAEVERLRAEVRDRDAWIEDAVSALEHVVGWERFLTDEEEPGIRECQKLIKQEVWTSR